MPRLRLHAFNSPSDPLSQLGDRDQAVYLRHYLADLGATTVIEEQSYFDRDYLSEFSAFYGVSSRGYSNACRRCTFFSTPIRREHIRAASEGSKRARKLLQDSYLGFVVIRPIPSAPLGRTVLKWYPDQSLATPRVTDPSREYVCHIAGFSLTVRGLAWQQQDTGVGACATIALWSLLHSSAFDDHHSIPTTADITRFANRTAALGSRVFPSAGLTISQLCEAIKESGLAPVVLQGDKDAGGLVGFSPNRFSSACASLIRSGYPALIIGQLGTLGKHAVCAAGFRECAASMPTPGSVELQDGGVKYIYLHDDNLGPSVRFEVTTDSAGHVCLKSSAPPRMHNAAIPPDPTANYPTFIPSQIVTAVHDDLRTSPDVIHSRALSAAGTIVTAHNQISPKHKIGLTISTRFMRLHDYLEDELGRTLSGKKSALGQARLKLTESIPPMSLHIGVARLGWRSSPLLDILFDTTDSDSNLTPFCNVQYNQQIGGLVTAMASLGLINLGPAVPTY